MAGVSLTCAAAQGVTPAPQRPPAGQPAQATIGSSARIVPPPATYRFPQQAYVYNVAWRLVPAGTATLRVQPAGAEQRVIGTADSAGVVSVLYRVRDRFESFLDPRTYCSRAISKKTEEGFRRLETNIRFDYARGKSVLEERNLKNNQTKRQENDIPACVTDVISALFYAGSLPLAPGEVSVFPLNDGGRTAEVRATVEGREEVKVPAGTFRTIRVRAEATQGDARERGKVWIWYSDDAHRTPVRMRARLTWGTLNFELARTEK